MPHSRRVTLVLLSVLTDTEYFIRPLNVQSSACFSRPLSDCRMFHCSKNKFSKTVKHAHIQLDSVSVYFCFNDSFLSIINKKATWFALQNLYKTHLLYCKHFRLELMY